MHARPQLREARLQFLVFQVFRLDFVLVEVVKRLIILIPELRLIALRLVLLPGITAGVRLLLLTIRTSLVAAAFFASGAVADALRPEVIQIGLIVGLGGLRGFALQDQWLTVLGHAFTQLLIRQRHLCAVEAWVHYYKTLDLILELRLRRVLLQFFQGRSYAAVVLLLLASLTDYVCH